MDTQKDPKAICPACKGEITNDAHGRPCCGRCEKVSHPKELYEEAFFDSSEYKK